MRTVLFLMLMAATGWAGEDWSTRTVVVYNDREPESRLLAEYYAQRRHVPTNQICAIHVRPVETITRNEFNTGVREPILRFLKRKEMADRVTCVALIYGVPLRIESDAALLEKERHLNSRPEMQRNEASVDSELALLPAQGLPAAGPLRNPFFNSPVEFAPPMNERMLLVGRLDGPDEKVVRQMIDDSLMAERYGLHGRAYFDGRSIQADGYAQGDVWIKGAWEALRDAGYECDGNEREELFDEDYPMTDVAVYAGWYAGNVAGPFKRNDFKFKPGAIAYHIHSTSAASVHTRVAGWVGPLLAKGAAASMGSVWEPYLAFTPRIDIFCRGIVSGRRFAEAGYASEPGLSWQTTFVGDPLCRPFAASLDEQLLLLAADRRPELEWAWLRKVNLLRRAGKETEATALCREKATGLRSAVLWEKLGDLQQDLKAYQHAMQHNTDTYTQLRLLLKSARIHEVNNQPALALAVFEELSAAYPFHKNVVEYWKRARDMAEAVGDKAKAQAWQARIDERTQKKPQDNLAK